MQSILRLAGQEVKTAFVHCKVHMQGVPEAWVHNQES